MLRISLFLLKCQINNDIDYRYVLYMKNKQRRQYAEIAYLLQFGYNLPYYHKALTFYQLGIYHFDANRFTLFQTRW